MYRKRRMRVDHTSGKGLNRPSPDRTRALKAGKGLCHAAYRGLSCLICAVLVALAFSGPVRAGEEQAAFFFAEHALPLEGEADLTPLVEATRGKKVVLLGEASHGTSEYYLWRKKISRRLIEEQGFSFIVVEGDWASCFKVNRYVKGLFGEDFSPEELLRESYHRWPRWMWANKEVVTLIEWLREHNSALPPEKRAGFYGMDVYGMKDSALEVIEYLESLDDEALRELTDNYKLLERFDYDGFAYVRGALSRGIDCREQVREVVEALDAQADELMEKDPYGYFNARMNALGVKNAERYYRSAMIGGPHGWNDRVLHMEKVLHELLEFHGEDAKGIVWAHNTHVGDARATAMRERGQINIGQLAREKFGDDEVLIAGFGTYKGTVVAGREWGSPLEVMRVPPGRDGSIESVLSHVPKDSFMLLFDEVARENRHMNRSRGHRAIGVVYNPDIEHLGNYVPTVLPARYDAFLFFRETRGLEPLGEE